ncbi:hypothetical protein LAJLEIBI_01295 [[Clostridium] hylemonae DSM 15053]|nr:hypothetical protein LAJLEIBI_01295 [[Clostridium] hylemonae DSM 15053]
MNFLYKILYMLYHYDIMMNCYMDKLNGGKIWVR